MSFQTIKSNGVKSLDVVEITTSVPQSQVNTLRQMIMHFILENNQQDVAYKLLELSNTRLRDDVKFWVRENKNN